MSINRRQFLAGAAALAGATVGAARPVSAATAPAVAALDESGLIYLTPMLPGGRESACHSEVWFVHHDGAIFVVTRHDAWRAEALRRGFEQARIWIGEFGVWSRGDVRYRAAPFLEIEGAIVDEAAVHAELLPLFGRKYAAEWDKWGPRFRDGLAEGSRVLLRYRY